MKKLSVSIILIIGLITWTGCSGIKPKTKDGAEKVFWGPKEKVIEFLQSPKAKANRWIVESIGE